MKRVKIEIEGMTCPNCEKHVLRELKLVGAREIKVNHVNNSAIFTVEDSLGEEVLKKTIEKAGYGPKKIFFKEIKKRGFFEKLFK